MTTVLFFLASDLPKFKEQVIDADPGVVYAITAADINGDGKSDVVAVTENPDQVWWYENPSWKRRVIVSRTPKLPVCIQAIDVDGDGKLELLLGADWQPGNRKTGGSVWILKRPANLDDAWTPIKVDEEPTMHRFRAIDIGGKKELVCSTLHGRDDKGAGLYVLKRPAKPFEDKWERETIATDLKVLHNIWPVDWDGDGKEDLLTGSAEGLSVFKRGDGAWTKTFLTPGDPKKPGAGEVKSGKLPNGKKYLAAIEPFHGPAAAVYTPGASEWTRHALVENHKGGHTVWTADLTGTGADSVVFGFRGPPEGKAGEWVVYIFHPADPAGEKWDKLVLDDKGMGCEDAVSADFNADGRIDIVAGGRGTKNVKIYWNEGK